MISRSHTEGQQTRRVTTVRLQQLSAGLSVPEFLWDGDTWRYIGNVKVNPSTIVTLITLGYEDGTKQTLILHHGKGY